MNKFLTPSCMLDISRSCYYIPSNRSVKINFNCAQLISPYSGLSMCQASNKQVFAVIKDIGQDCYP